uniref:Uncharacterized protein n=1 Tax=Romanomermis culicivorax TaxID=13658 RepID=A0A915K913_ROMCU
MDKADPRSEEIDVAIVQIIAVENQPFGVIENQGFIDLIRKLATYQLKRKKCYERMIWKQYDLKN